MKDNTKNIKCSCCGKELKTYNSIVEKESYGYMYSVDYHKELETFVCDEEGEKKFGVYLCTDCNNDTDKSVKAIIIQEGQTFLNNIDIIKQNLEKELFNNIESLKQKYLEDVKNTDIKFNRIQKDIENIENIEDIKSIEFSDIKVMEKYYPNLKVLSDYKKKIPVEPLNRSSQNSIYESGICPTCGRSVLNNFPYGRRCNNCSQLLTWD
jgi:hypothetical protein